MTDNVKPFPPMMPGESTLVTAEEASRINTHCESLHAEVLRLRKALDDIFMIVAYVNTHGVGEQPESNGIPQPLRVTPEEFRHLFQKIGTTAREALGTEAV